MLKKLPLFICILITFTACEQTYTPKAKGYNRIDLPAHNYQQLTGDYPYTFQYSTHAKVKPHESTFTEPYWIDIVYQEMRGTLEITYKKIGGKKQLLDELVDDSHKLAAKHNVKATAIDEAVIKTPKGYTAAIFELEGEVPSQFQFYVTDSTSNFLRGALYFPISTKNDSLRPVIDYIKVDIIHMLNTLEWK